MSDPDDLRQRLAELDPEAEPEAFWVLLTDEAVEAVKGAFAFVLLRDEDEEFVVFPGQGVDPSDLEDLAESPTFGAALEAVALDAPARAEASPDGPESVFSVAVPIRIEGDVAGAVAVERYDEGAFSGEAADHLSAVVGAFGPALAKFFE